MWYFRALHAHVGRELLARLGGGAAQLLDAGCGTGGLIRRLGPDVPLWQWTGVDLSPLACELARARCKVPILEASVVALPFADGAFDGVVSADVLYHVESDVEALREFSRVLRPGGVLVLNVPAYRWLWSYHDEATHARRRYGRGKLRDMLRMAGLSDVRATHWNALLLPLITARRKLLPAPRSGSDVRRSSTLVEALCNAAMALERGWLGVFGQLPFGSSILAVARKN